jgi:hypothetical protein
MKWYFLDDDEPVECHITGGYAKREDVEPMLEEYWRMKSKLNAIRWLCLRADEMDNKVRDRKQGDD